VEPAQLTPLDAAFDCSCTEPGIEKLAAGDDPVLSRGEVRQSPFSGGDRTSSSLAMGCHLFPAHMGG
jgi:hypothetical protein